MSEEMTKITEFCLNHTNTDRQKNGCDKYTLFMSKNYHNFTENRKFAQICSDLTSTPESSVRISWRATYFLEMFKNHNTIH